MSESEILHDLKERLNKKTIHELRQIARAVGVPHPADGKKERLMDEILDIATCRTQPSPRSTRGAPPKSTDFDKLLVADIEKCISYYSSIKEGTGVVNDMSLSSTVAEETCRGILCSGEKYRYLRVNGCLPSLDDVFVHESFVTRFALEDGDCIEGVARRRAVGEAPGLASVSRINGAAPDAVVRRKFSSLTPVYPSARIRTGCGIATRMIDFLAPIGRGQRAVVETPSNFREADLIKELAVGIDKNHPDIKVAVLLLCARPEDATDISRAAQFAEVFSTPLVGREAALAAAKTVGDYMTATAECGSDALLIVSGLSALGEEDACRLLGRACCTEEGPSLTVIAFAAAPAGALIRAANCVIKIDGDLSAVGVCPVSAKSYTLNGGLVQGGDELACANGMKKYAMNSRAGALAELFGCYGDGELMERFKDGR